MKPTFIYFLIFFLTNSLIYPIEFTSSWKKYYNQCQLMWLKKIKYHNYDLLLTKKATKQQFQQFITKLVGRDAVFKHSAFQNKLTLDIKRCKSNFLQQSSDVQLFHNQLETLRFIHSELFKEELHQEEIVLNNARDNFLQEIDYITDQYPSAWLTQSIKELF